MTEPVIHPVTRQAIERLAAKPSHAVLIAGQKGIGKRSLANYVAATLVSKPVEELPNYPYIYLLSSEKTNNISVEDVRELEHFLSRRVPGDAPRIVIIEDAQFMSTEAQNALLKTLEEPPLGSTILLTATNEYALLPTVRSRATTLRVVRPENQALNEYFVAQGHPQDVVKKNLFLAGGLPGLTAALLADSADHPLVSAVNTAREILQKNAFERLCMVDELVKQKELCRDVLQILQQMAHIALLSPKASPRWRRVLETAYETGENIANSAQPKLALTKFMLEV